MGGRQFQAAARRASRHQLSNGCAVDQIATEALKRNKRRYQIVFSAADFGARFAAVAAGLARAADATTGSTNLVLKNMPRRRWVFHGRYFRA